MKLCRFQPLDAAPKNAGNAHEGLYGILENGSVFEIRGDFFGARERTGRKWPSDKVKFLAPAVPTKIVAVGRNYREHVKEFNNPLPKEPAIFLKPPSSMLAPGDPIVLPVLSQKVEYEGELGLVIAKRCFHVKQ